MSAIDWTLLGEAELRKTMDAGRAECDRRIAMLMEAMNGNPKGPGRPRKNGALTLSPGDLEPADSDS